MSKPTPRKGCGGRSIFSPAFIRSSTPRIFVQVAAKPIPDEDADAFSKPDTFLLIYVDEDLAAMTPTIDGNGLLEPDSARKEVDRYLGSPTQPMSYLVGFLAMERMREAYQAKYGDREDWELEFHTRLLSFGSVPLRLVEKVLLEERP